MKKYSWKRDLPDHRDLKFTISAVKLASKVDLTPQMPPVYDQGNLGSCTANAAGAAFEYTIKLEKKKDYMPSRLYIYFNERLIDGTISYDAGSSIRTSMKALNKYGAANETLWPYLAERLTVSPTKTVYADGLAHLATQYLAVGQDLNSLKTCLSQGYPIVFGFSVYDSFESNIVANTGIVPMPGINESLLGGHAALIVGYDDAHNWFIVRNSWGKSWGKGGYFYLPYQYVTNPNLASDFWSVRVAQ